MASQMVQTSPSALPLCSRVPRVLPTLPVGLAPGRAMAVNEISDKWQNGTVIHYCFLGDWEATQKNIVNLGFQTWKSKGVGLEFKETDDVGEAEVRIEYSDDNTSWSLVGTEVLQSTDTSQATMHFGWDLTTPWGHATAIHEIGHTLGLDHEHQSPFSGIKWNEDLVYESFAAPPNNWDRTTIYNNILKKLDPSSVTGTVWDPTSIMEYPFDPGLIAAPKPYDDDGIGQNTTLSKQDIAWAVKLYPPLGAPQTINLMQLAQLNTTAALAQTDFVFQPAASRKYTIQTVGESDSRIIVFENRSGVPRYLHGADDLAKEENVKFDLKLVKGRSYTIRVRVAHSNSPSGVALLIS